MKIYHNPRCSKSRCALDWLKENNFDVEIIDYIKKPISEIELNSILNLLKYSPLELMRKNELEYKQLIQGKELPDNELISLMVKFPKLIERPIIIRENQAVVARPLENLIEMLQNQH